MEAREQQSRLEKQREDEERAAEKRQREEERAEEKERVEASLALTNAASLSILITSTIEASKTMIPAPSLTTATIPSVDTWRTWVYNQFQESMAIAKLLELGLKDTQHVSSVEICEKALSLACANARVTGAMVTALIATQSLAADVHLAPQFVHAYNDIASALAREEPTDKTKMLPTNVRSVDAITKTTALATVKTARAPPAPTPDKPSTATGFRQTPRNSGGGGGGGGDWRKRPGGQNDNQAKRARFEDRDKN